VKKTPLLTLCLFLLMAASIEMILRLPTVQQYLPIPDWCTGYDPLEERLFLLDQFEREQGQVDCIFMGSSSAETALDPAIFEAAYQSRSGQAITCYNFGIGAFTGSSAGIIGELLIERYHPRWLIFGTAAIDYDTRDVDIEQAFPETAWARYRRGEFNLMGWLVDSFSTVRYLSAIPDELNTAPRETPFIDPDRYKRMAGYAPLVDFVDFRIQESTGIFTAPDMEGFRQLIAAVQGSDTRLLVIEIPIYVTSSPAYTAQNPIPAGQIEFNEQVMGYAHEHGIPAWRTHGEIVIPDRYWRDTFHLHISGAMLFSQWLGEQVGEATRRDEWDQPPLELDLNFEPFTQNLGLSPKAYADYEATRQTFDLLPAEAILFDPSENIYEPRELQTFLGLYTQWSLNLSAENRGRVYQFMALLDRVRRQHELDLTPEQTAALDRWRVGKSPDDLPEIEYLFVPSAWYSFLPPAEQTAFEENYQRLVTINDPTHEGTWYGVYRVSR
jgi:hypothetical protein